MKQQEKNNNFNILNDYLKSRYRLTANVEFEDNISNYEMDIDPVTNTIEFINGDGVKKIIDADKHFYIDEIPTLCYCEDSNYHFIPTFKKVF